MISFHYTLFCDSAGQQNFAWGGKAGIMHRTNIIYTLSFKLFLCWLRSRTPVT